MTSIIIPHFNRISLLKETISSIFSQSIENWEIIIVDDQSDNAEWAALQKFASDKVKVLQRKQGEKGPSSCRNLGAHHAKGDYLLFLDSDDLLAPFCVGQRASAMEAHREADACVFLMREFENGHHENGSIFNLQVEEKKWIASFIRNENPWNVTCPIWKKDSFQRAGGFDESLLYMEDPDLHLRALNMGLQFKTFYLMPADCYYRVHHFDKTKSSFYYNSIMYRIRFYQKLTGGFYSKDFLVQYNRDIKVGVNSLIKTFLYSRKNQYPELYIELLDWMHTSGLYSDNEIRKYRFLIETGNTESRLLQKLKIKGICYNMLPR